MKLIAYGEEYMTKVIECKFKADDYDADAMQKARYGIMALAKSTDGKFIDCILAIYSLEFKLACTKKQVKKDYSFLRGLLMWTRTEERSEDMYIEKETIDKFQNFFRHKALQAFKQEGMVDDIPYTDVPALPE